MRNSSPATLIGACLLALAATAAPAQPVPTPAPRPKAVIAPPPAAVPDSKAAQLVPAQGSGLFPFKLPGFSQPGTTTAFDANQRALIDRVNVYLMSVQTLVGDFVQIANQGLHAHQVDIHPVDQRALVRSEEHTSEL